MQRNPFTPGFGQIPPFLAGRDYMVADITNAFEAGTGDPNLTTLFVGARGTGKTTLLSYLAEQALPHGWITASVSAIPGMLDDIVLRIRRAGDQLLDQEASARLTSVSLGQLGGIAWEHVETPDNWRSRMDLLLDELEKHGTGLLIAVDEVRGDLDEMITLASVYQHFIREGRKVSLLMAGLPHQVSALLRNDSTSFLRRAFRRSLGRIPDYEVEQAFRLTVESAGRSIDDDALELLVQASEGFPYMMQLTGFRAWNQQPGAASISKVDARRGIELAAYDFETQILEPTFFELSDGDIAFIRAMLEDSDPSKLSDIAQRMDVTSGYASQYKKRLLEQGVIGERGRATFDFDIPRFREYINQHI